MFSTVDFYDLRVVFHWFRITSYLQLWNFWKTCMLILGSRDLQTFFVRESHMLLHNSSRAGHLT